MHNESSRSLSRTNADLSAGSYKAFGWRLYANDQDQAHQAQIFPPTLAIVAGFLSDSTEGESASLAIVVAVRWAGSACKQCARSAW